MFLLRMIMSMLNSRTLKDHLQSIFSPVGMMPVGYLLKMLLYVKWIHKRPVILNHFVFKKMISRIYGQTTTCLGKLILSSPEPIPIQSLLYKTNTCLTQPATTFFCLPNEKNLSKTTTAKFYPAEKWEAMHKNWTSLQFYLLYCYFIMQNLFNVYKKLNTYN